tara:strand:+ start:34812 stop:35537 length:726 start_codon:yes stop_codon:yes gene_type:complete
MSELTHKTQATQNVDPAEIAQFSQQAQQWWDPAGPMKMLHTINPIRMAFILDQTELSGKKVLDIGCGAGILTEALSNHGADVLGIDMSEAAIQAAKQHSENLNTAIEYQSISAENLAESHASQYDIITCLECLEHVPDPTAILAACQKLLKPNGLLFLSTLNRNAKSYVHAIIGAEYILNMIPKGTHQYARFIKPSELTRWSRACGFHLQKLSGIKYHPITKSFNITNDVSVNYLACYKLK